MPTNAHAANSLECIAPGVLGRGVHSVHCTSHDKEAYTYTPLELKGLSHLSLGSEGKVGAHAANSLESIAPGVLGRGVHHGV